jgi:hypothetical protein
MGVGMYGCGWGNPWCAGPYGWYWRGYGMGVGVGGFASPPAAPMRGGHVRDVRTR